MDYINLESIKNVAQYFKIYQAEFLRMKRLSPDIENSLKETICKINQYKAMEEYVKKYIEPIEKYKEDIEKNKKAMEIQLEQIREHEEMVKRVKEVMGSLPLKIMESANNSLPSSKLLTNLSKDIIEYDKIKAQNERKKLDVQHSICKQLMHIKLLLKKDYMITFGQYCQLKVEDIDSFEKIRNIEEKDIKSLLPLKIEEKEIKRWIHDILNDPNMKKDWGGETSDIFTRQLIFRKKRVNAAFLLKGKSSSNKTLTLSLLGKRGDQIARLFKEPASIYIIQCNGNIAPTIDEHMKAFTIQKITENRKAHYYCIIDGVSTTRLLVAYNKLSFK